MRVLLAHNFYRSSAPSGEDSVYLNEKKMLESNIDVVSYERHNDNIDESTLSRKIQLALNCAWSSTVYKEISMLIDKTHPDIAHFHNTFPQISTSAYAACQDKGIPVVQTLHNYRFICPNALLLRDKKPCEDCLNGNLFPAFVHRCYRDSYFATAAQIWSISSNRSKDSYGKLVNRYIALTDFAASKFVEGGLPAARIVIKPNFLPNIHNIGTGEGKYAIYVGRLSEEKGVRTLINAWEHLRDIPLKILGDGPLRLELEHKASSIGLPIEFMGYCDSKLIFEMVSQALFQIVPSECYEGFPMVVLEAFSCGTPVIASRIGSLDEIIKEDETGLKFKAGQANDLAKVVRSVVHDKQKLNFMRYKARSIFLKEYTQEKNLKMLNYIYGTTIEDYNKL